MKKVLWTLGLLTFATSSFAQQTSIVIDGGQSKSELNKVVNIEAATKTDLKIIESKSTSWNSKVSVKNNEINTKKTILNSEISRLQNLNDSFKLVESDPGAKTYAKKNVPTCYGNKPRLIYDVSAQSWKCLAIITCAQLDSGKSDWITDISGKCVKPKTVWKVNSWAPSTCTSGIQTRSVTCVLEDNQTSALDNDACSGPSPIKTRPCAGQ